MLLLFLDTGFHIFLHLFNILVKRIKFCLQHANSYHLIKKTTLAKIFFFINTIQYFQGPTGCKLRISYVIIPKHNLFIFFHVTLSNNHL